MTVVLRAVEGNADLAFALQITAMNSTDAILQWKKAQWCDHIIACLMQALGVGEENLSKLCEDLQNCYDTIQQGRFQGREEAMHDAHMHKCSPPVQKAPRRHVPEQVLSRLTQAMHVALPDAPVCAAPTCDTAKARDARLRAKETELLCAIMKRAGPLAAMNAHMLHATGANEVYKQYLWHHLASGTLKSIRQNLTAWMLWHHQHMEGKQFFPWTIPAVMAYIAYRVNNGCGHTVPQKIVYTVGAGIKLFMMPELQLHGTLIQGLVQGYLKSKTTETKQAPPISVAMLIMLEKGFHIHKEAKNATALICGMWLFLVNTSMRFSDSGWINPWTMRLASVQTTKGAETVLRGRCSKAKSDQLGIRSQFACPDFYLNAPWLVEWYEMYMLFPHDEADFLFPSIALRAGKVKVDFSKGADHKEALTASKAVFRNLCKDLGTNLADEIRELTFHSCRTTMVDLSAAAGCSIASMLTQMRSMSPAMAMRYIRENGTMVAQVSRDIKNMLIHKDNSLIEDAEVTALCTDTASLNEVENVEVDDMLGDVPQGHKCPWCDWKCSSTMRKDLLDHMKSCAAEDENSKVIECHDDEEWFKVGAPPQDPTSPIRITPASHFHWHLPSDMGVTMSMCGLVEHTAHVTCSLQAAVPSEDVCYECLARSKHRWDAE